MKIKLSLIVCCCLFAFNVMAKDATCKISSHNVITYKGDCDFIPLGDGSFVLTGKVVDISPNVESITVVKIGKNTSEVNGLTSEGINSRWGNAARSSKDKACWKGSDFEVCAY